MLGKEIRIKKLFSKGNIIVVAIDHGAEFGPVEGLIDLPATIKLLKNADGILLNPGMVEHTKEFFSSKDSPSMILRISWTTSYCFPWKYKTAETSCILSVSDSISYGADVVIACCNLKTESEQTDNENIKIFSDIVAEKEKFGIPLIGEVYPLNASELDKDTLHSVVYRNVRIVAELGADIIKTFYTGNKFSEVVKSVPIPILVLGGEKMDKEDDALELAKKAVNSGAKGVVFGRNVFQSKEPGEFLFKLKNTVRK